MSDPRPPKRIRDPDAIRRFRLAHAYEPCEICELRPGTDVHHDPFRSRGGSDIPQHMKWVCRSCHDAEHGIGV